MRVAAGAGLLGFGVWLWGAGLGAAQERPERPEPRSAPRPGPAATFESLFALYVRADKAGDLDGARRAFQEIRRLRIERNVLNLEPVALALVAQGKEKLDQGDREAAEELFASAVAIGPNLPDGHLGAALAAFKRGPLGFVPAVGHTFEAFVARLPTARGRYHTLLFLVPAVLLAAFFAAALFAAAMMLRHGPLLRHDIEESMGGGRARSVALALHLLLLLLPVATFQGWGWLFPWWLALLFAYMGWVERAVSLVLVLGALATGPALLQLEQGMAGARNPLFWAAVSSVESASDPVSITLLESASQATPDDRDLRYLLAAQYRKAGRYDEAAQRYQEILKAAPDDPVAANNLANLEFARGDFQAALGRYRQGAEKAADPELKAVFFYNQSLAHLQKFEMQPADEALSQARRASSGLISEFDGLWKYDKGDYAVVDLGLSTEEVERKFRGVSSGSGRKNVWRKGAEGGADFATALLNRFAAFLGVAALAIGVLAFWRGRKTFTMRCLKCGTPFCRKCHLGAAVAGLCSQCYHLFVVRDGVSGPARNRKLLEVQAEEGRQDWAFRLLTTLLPGAGQVYRGAPILGLLLSAGFGAVLAVLLLAGRFFPVTEAPRALSGQPLGLVLGGLLLVGLYVVAHRVKPESDVVVPVRRGARGRARG